ncbi:MAG: serine/threonine protein kinase [Anaerolineaceae bacterium]|nr:serine/threonine protein kinase [Anaerolineaceae bacterium]
MDNSPDSVNNLPVLGNRYRLLQTIGAGGMAVVYRAQDLSLNRQVAIKLLRQDYSRHTEFSQRFQQEAYAAAALSHSNIVTVHDFGQDAGRYFIVMELIEGRDLKKIIEAHFKPVATDWQHMSRPKDERKVEIKRNQELVTRACYLVFQACSGIGYAHRMHLVHCDVKPHNMLVTRDWRLKVTDFGIARALSTIDANEQNEEVWGSPQYFSPEQAAGHAPSPASDVYSLGIILYELLTGRLPFNSNDPQELARQHREGRVIPPSRFNNQIPPELEKILLKVLQKDPNQRYGTAGQFGRVLYKFTGSWAGYQAAPQVEPEAEPVYAPPPAGSTRPSTPSQPAAPSPEDEVQEPSWLDQIASLLTPDILILGLLAMAMLASTIPFLVYVATRLGMLN